MENDSPSSGVTECRQCQRPLSWEANVASISGSIMGDEHTDSYFLCPVCNSYTVVSSWDNFTGLETINSSGPLARQAGDAQVDLIRRCARPWDKKCRCDAHRTYFRGTLD